MSGIGCRLFAGEMLSAFYCVYTPEDQFHIDADLNPSSDQKDPDCE